MPLYGLEFIMKKFKIKKNDTVVVIAGKHKKETGKVLSIISDKDLVLVEGVNMVTRHVKATSDRQGTTLRKEAPIHISNVALYDSASQKKVKVGYKLDNGKKVRINKATGESLDT